MSEPKKYQPTASIIRSKLKPRKVTAKGKNYQVTQYSISKDNFLKFCRELKEFGMDNIKYINFDVWEAIDDETQPADQTANQYDDLPF